MHLCPLFSRGKSSRSSCAGTSVFISWNTSTTVAKHHPHPWGGKKRVLINFAPLLMGINNPERALQQIWGSESSARAAVTSIWCWSQSVTAATSGTGTAGCEEHIYLHPERGQSQNFGLFPSSAGLLSLQSSVNPHNSPKQNNSSPSLSASTLVGGDASPANEALILIKDTQCFLAIHCVNNKNQPFVMCQGSAGVISLEMLPSEEMWILIDWEAAQAAGNSVIFSLSAFCALWSDRDNQSDCPW